MSTSPNTATESASLAHRAMLASVTVRRWMATRTDNSASAEVAKAHAVNQRRAGHYRKHAINVDAPSFKAVTSAASDIRTTHYKFTLPWGQDGCRILTAVSFAAYSREIREKCAAFDRAVAAFLADYPNLVTAARSELNSLFDADDYPTNIAAKFGVDRSILPLPQSQDFRVTLAADQVDAIKAGIESEIARSTAEAMREPYTRLYEHIGRMVERLSDPKAIFRDSLVTGLAELCAVLPGLNLTGDAVLSDLCHKAEQLIAGVNPQTLRDSPQARTAVAQKAAEIADLMAGFMGGAP